MNGLNHVHILDLYTRIESCYKTTSNAGWNINVVRRKDGVVNAYPTYVDSKKQFVSRLKAYELLCEQLKGLEGKI
ncbi:hypothetical protein HYT57_00880 [Candidatus Woesearchaeota archaeon]|nr:hypothetical protein [Candidatus Woesearchaeota archaeon]